jgi:hypothetical protein
MEVCMKNKLSDLNDHLFAQLERLAEEELAGEKLVEEIERSRAIGLTARTIIDNARLVLDAQKAVNDTCFTGLPTIFGVEPKPLKIGRDGQ